ncbi:tetratricopeptide repeat protein [Scytonema sp. PCC 10023]|uniref:tetratricopeptide repeat protein n=1 Tax=Scytonema sp. PCC 10023 TaxID=1680591 RepID=UPI0039C72225
MNQREQLQELYDLLEEKIVRLRKARIIETDPLVLFKLDKQIEAEEEERRKIAQQIDNLESVISRTSTSHTKRLRQHNITLNPQFSSILGFVGVSVIAVVVGFNWWSQNQQMSKLPSVAPIHQSEPNSNTPQINLKTVETKVVSAIATEKLSQGDLQVGLQAVEELLNRNQLSNAESALNAVPQESADNPSVYFFKGRLVWQSIQTGDNKYSVDDARRYWESAVEAQPNSPLYNNALGFAYYAQGNLNRANDSWFKALGLAVREQNTSASSTAFSPSNPLRQNVLTSYAGFAIGLYKTANNQPVGKREQYLNEAIRLRQMVTKEDPVNFELRELGKNWLWPETALQDWKALLQLKSQRSAFQKDP